MISIESIEFGGFAGSLDEKLEFNATAINLLEETAATRTLIPAAVLAILFGFSESGALDPGFDDICDINKYRPNKDQSQKFLASMILTHDERRIKIIRDFAINKITIFDCSEPENDITKQILGEDLSEPGFKLTSLSKEEFCARCIFTSDQSVSNSPGFGKLQKFLSTSANSASGRQAQAVLLLENVLNQYPYKSNNVMVKIQIDFFIEELKKQMLRLKQKIREFDQRRHALWPLLAKIPEIETNLAQRGENSEAAQYFKLCLRAAEIDSQVLQLRSNSIRINRIEQELARIGAMDNFQIDLQQEIETLWTRRLSLLKDYQTLEAEYAKQMKDYETEESAVRKRWLGVQSFTEEQAQILLQLVGDLTSAYQDMDQFLVRSRLEEEWMKEANLDLTKTDQIKESMRLLGKQKAKKRNLTQFWLARLPNSFHRQSVLTGAMKCSLKKWRSISKNKKEVVG